MLDASADLAKRRFVKLVIGIGCGGGFEGSPIRLYLTVTLTEVMITSVAK
jgi:hypothetical protein